MAHSRLEVTISGRIDGRIRRLAAESEIEYDEVVHRLLSPERVTRLAGLRSRPALTFWGFGRHAWRRTAVLRIGLEVELHERIRAIAAASGASNADVARYLLTGGQTNDQLDAEARSREPLVP